MKPFTFRLKRNFLEAKLGHPSTIASAPEPAVAGSFFICRDLDYVWDSVLGSFTIPIENYNRARYFIKDYKIH